MRLAVVHGPDAAASLRDLLTSVPEGVSMVLAFRDVTATRFPALVEAASLLFEVRILSRESPASDLGHVDNVMTFSDAEVDFTDRLRAATTGEVTPGNPWSKPVQRAAFTAAGLSSVKFRGIDGPGGLADAAEEVGYPCVVKPARSAGGDGIYLLQHGAQVPTTRDRLNDGPYVVEGLIDQDLRHPAQSWLGSMFSVETATAERAQHRHLATIAKLPIQLVSFTEPGLLSIRECGSVSPSLLPSEVEEVLIAVAHAALDCLGVEQRVTQTELFLTATGPKIVEVNGRPGGEIDRILRLTGEVSLTRAAIEIAAGLAVSPALPPSAIDERCALGYFPSFSVLDGLVRGSATRSTLMRFEGVAELTSVAAPGYARREFGSRVVDLVLAGGSPMDVRTRLEALKLLLAECYAPDLGIAPDLLGS